MTNAKTVKPAKQEEHEDFLKNIPDEALPEVMQLFGVPQEKIAEGMKREEMLELLRAAKRQDIAVSKTISTPDGKSYECPPGHMVIKVTPKSGIEWGKRTKSFAYFAVQGQSLVVKRGSTEVVPDKYRSAWRDAVRTEYDEQDGLPILGADGQYKAAPVTSREVMAEDVQELYWNRDLEAEKRAEEELKAGAKQYQDEQKAAKALKAAIIGNVVGMK